MKYELINPSDKIFLTADNLVDAAFACWLISSSYGLRDDQGNPVVPIAMFGGMTEWFAEHGVSFSGAPAYIETHKSDIATILDSCEYAMERTSLTDIGKRCKALAEALRKATLK